MISIVIPYITPELVENVIELAQANAGDIPVEIVSGYDRERIGAGPMLNKLVASARHNLVAFVADDTLPQPGYLKHALKAMATLPDGWGLVSFNDDVYSGPGKTAFHWLADKRLLPILGGVFMHEGYKHCRADVELTERCEAEGRHVYCPEARVVQNRQDEDENYKIFYSEEWVKHDQELFKQRKAEGWP